MTNMNKGVHTPGEALPSSISDPKLQLVFTADQIHARVAEMGAAIGRDFAGQPLLLCGVLKGAAIFLADLVRVIPIECTYDFVAAESYGHRTKSSGTVRLTRDLPDGSITGRNVLLVEDILDSGATLAHVRDTLLRQRPARLAVAVLLDKPSRRRVAVAADYIGFTIPDRFVVGYGMDFAERYRQLPDICFLQTAI
jgi:hypoxanthine phosphoribosyltransferase